MFIFVSLIHVVMCMILIIIVLLQTGKGSDLASAFGGGGSNTMFGSHGAASFLNKLTTVAAIMFMLTSLSLAILSAGPDKSIMDDIAIPDATQNESDAVLPETSETGAIPEATTENSTEGAMATEQSAQEDANPVTSSDAEVEGAVVPDSGDSTAPATTDATTDATADGQPEENQ